MEKVESREVLGLKKILKFLAQAVEFFPKDENIIELKKKYSELEKDEKNEIDLKSILTKEESSKLLEIVGKVKKHVNEKKIKEQIEKEKNISWKVWHGMMGKKEWSFPKCVARTAKISRSDQKVYINASEYNDSIEVLDEKMKIVAELIKKSKFCICYTGAGISRSSGIADYGSKAENSVTKNFKKLEKPYLAKPTYSHYVLSNLERKGLLHYYVQQNHDGLPQKAGYPQHKINEIHGAWFDPSNPVVMFSGSLRTDLFNEMIEVEKKTDLCLTLGTSLSGMNSDRVTKTPSLKYYEGVKDCMGSVVINLQFTRLDIEGFSPIRIWAKCDEALKLLVKHLEMKIIPLKMPEEESDVVIVPYDKNGQYNKDMKQVLDVSLGAMIRICEKNASNLNSEAMVIKKTSDGHYIMDFFDEKDGKGVRRMFGKWWLSVLKNGKVKNMPLMNLNPKFKN